MKVITKYPVVYSNACGCGYSSLDGSSSSKEIKLFQSWASNKGYNDKSGRPLAIDGKWGTKTAFVYNTYGKEFESERGQKISVKKDATNSGSFEAKQAKQALKDSQSSQEVVEKKPMSKGVKIAIGVGILAIFATITYFVVKKK